MAEKKTDWGMLALLGLGGYFLFRKPSQGEPSVEVGLRWNPGGDPTFYAGSTHTATVTLLNPTAWDWIYYVTLGPAGPLVFPNQVSPDTPVAAGASTTFAWNIPMSTEVNASPSTIVTVSVWNAEGTIEDYFVFSFGGVNLIGLPLAGAEVGLTWDAASTSVSALSNSYL